MKISDVELVIVEVERSGGRPSARALLVCLTADSGLEGWGEAPTTWRPSEMADRRRALWAALAGHSVFDIEEMLRLDVTRHLRLASALEMAAWDLIGRAFGEPLCHVMGGGYRQHIPLSIRLPTRGAADMQQVARELAEQGFHAQIVTAEGRAESDAAAVQETAEAAGERAEVQLDGAGRYDLAAARELCSQLTTDTLTLLVDPLDTPDLEAVASLARQTDIPLGLCSGIHGARDVMAAVRSGAAAHILVDLSRVGGLLAARRCAAVADAGGLGVSLVAETSIGVAFAAMLHAAAATPDFDSGNQTDYCDLADDLLAESIEIVDGMAAVPQSPGLGVQVDRGKLERYQVT